MQFHQRLSKAHYPLSKLMRKKQAVDIQVHNHVIYLLSKRNKRTYVSAKIYVYEWDWCYLSRRNLLDFAHSIVGKCHWHITEFKGNIYNAMMVGYTIFNEDGTIEDAPNPPLVKNIPN